MRSAIMVTLGLFVGCSTRPSQNHGGDVEPVSIDGDVDAGVVIGASDAGGATDAFLPSPVCGAASRQVGVTHATVKIRATSPVPDSTTILLEAARNEVEPFQIAINGGPLGVGNLQVGKAPLVREDGVSISNVRLFREGLFNVRWASSAEGASGYWPDPLIPDVDAYEEEARNAFVDFDVPAGETRAVWVDVRVPADQPPGLYLGTFTVSGMNLPATAVEVRLRVRNFTLPSTPTLRSAFNLAADAVTRAHFGGQWCSDFSADQTNAILTTYARAGLDHRISLMSPICGDPTQNLARFDRWQGELLSGTSATELEGARLQSFRNPASGGSAMTTLEQHFDANQWTGLFDYDCDEPPHFCDESAWPARARAAHAAGIPNLVTTTYEYLQQKGWTDLVDIVCPVAETMNDASRLEYDDFLALGPTKELWWYQSCDSHGCGGCDAGQESFNRYQGLPSYVIDSDARQNRSMEWLSFIYDVSGELYFETANQLDHGRDWTSGVAYCAFGGNGDGTLFYPGVPSDPRIGGTTHFPIESIRMKLIREGMEDYEYLVLYAEKMGREAAVKKARSVFPDVFGSKTHPAEVLYEIRRQLADEIEGTVEPIVIDVPYVESPDLTSDLSEAPAIMIAAGAAHATFRVAWNADALHVVADVEDADLRANGRGEDGALYDADSIEVMLDPALARTALATLAQTQVIVSAANDKYDALGAGSTGDAAYDLAGLEWQATIDGTLDDQSSDRGYRVAMRIPWSSLMLPVNVAVAPGLVLGLDLALDNLDAAGLRYADWAGVEPFAQPSRWNQVRLAGAECR
jgi:hypothetical protein